MRFVNRSGCYARKTRSEFEYAIRKSFNSVLLLSISVIALTINGQVHALEVAPDTPLVFVLRNELGLTGTKIGCANEQCGACAVLVNGESTLSCVRPVADFVDRKVDHKAIGRRCSGRAYRWRHC
ncbi:MAG: 2Fe-2S iron-sulfur cluster binding domain-containing protein [Gammaproteobacteria bacterium]|nr:2Fe-2S iron-sulfur cluster binding domain-containing protein [Gammaproteobacteria bacterium]